MHFTVLLLDGAKVKVTHVSPAFKCTLLSWVAGGGLTLERVGGASARCGDYPCVDENDCTCARGEDGSTDVRAFGVLFQAS